MYIPVTSSFPDHRLVLAPTEPLENAHFTLDTSGVVGIFGGDEAVSAMTTVLVYKSRRWLGWYNSPGSYQIARRYGLLTKSKLFNVLFPGVRADPATLLELDGWKGPRFRAVQSGTIIEETGHIAALFMKECATRPPGAAIEWRETQPTEVTIAELRYAPEPEMRPECINPHSPILDCIPIAVSVGANIACGVYGDWYSFSMILLGIFSMGISCCVIGTGVLVFRHPKPAGGVPPGDGILGSGKEIVLLRGSEDAVNCVTRGSFSLDFSSEYECECIGWCSVLFIIQVVAQLLLIPHGHLFGQVMFITSLAVSWLYNSWLSTLDKKKMQQNILFRDVLQFPVLTKYRCGTHTTMTVFIVLVLQPTDPRANLDEFLPNNTPVWDYWKRIVVDRLVNNRALQIIEEDWESPNWFTPQERTLLATLYRDAEAAYSGYITHVAPPN